MEKLVRLLILRRLFCKLCFEKDEISSNVKVYRKLVVKMGKFLSFHVRL